MKVPTTAKWVHIAKKHQAAIYLAILVSILSAFPQAFFRIDHKELYTEGITAIEMLPDSPWSARTREVQDGYNLGSMYYKEGKDDPYLFQPLGSMIWAWTGELFNLDINNTFLLSRILYPALAALLFYAFVYALSRDKLAAICSVALILLADAIISPSGVLNLLSGEILQGVSPQSFLEISRPVNSSMIFIFFFGFLLAFVLYYRNRNWIWGLSSAILLGANFYNYFYSWTYLYAFGGVLGLIFLFQRKYKDMFEIAYVFLGGLVVAIPYILNLYTATLYPSYAEVGERFGVVLSHGPQFFGVTVLAALFLFLLGMNRKHDMSAYLFTLALLLAPIITLNQQLISGRVLQESHYHWYTHKPVAVIAALITVFYLMRRWNFSVSLQKMFATIIVLFSIAFGFTVQALSYYNDFDGRDGGIIAVERQKYAPVMHWLNQNAEEGEVVFGNEEASHVTVIYTPLNVFHQRAAHYSLSATRDRLIDILFTYYTLRDLNEENIEQTIYDERVSISVVLYAVFWRDHANGYENIPEEILDELVERYMERLETDDHVWLQDVWNKYDVSYVVWDTKTEPTWDLDQYEFLTLEEDFGQMKVYSVTK